MPFSASLSYISSKTFRKPEKNGKNSSNPMDSPTNPPAILPTVLPALLLTTPAYPQFYPSSYPPSYPPSYPQPNPSFYQSSSSTPSHSSPTLRNSPPPSQLQRNCRECHKPLRFDYVKAFNVNGNSRRPYYSCNSCTDVFFFVDDRGLDPSNPHCYCGRPSRRLKKNATNQIFYKCVEGECGFSGDQLDENRQRVCIDESVVNQMAELKVI